MKQANINQENSSNYDNINIYEVKPDNKNETSYYQADKVTFKNQETKKIIGNYLNNNSIIHDGKAQDYIRAQNNTNEATLAEYQTDNHIYSHLERKPNN